MRKSASKSPNGFIQSKNSLAQKVLSTDQPELVSILNDMYVLYAKHAKKRISIKQYNKEIDEAEKRIKQGKFVKHEDVLKEMDNW